MGSTHSVLAKSRSPQNSPLLNLPNELLTIIAESLDSENDVYSLFLTSRRLSQAITPHLLCLARREEALGFLPLNRPTILRRITLLHLLLANGIGLTTTIPLLSFAVEIGDGPLAKVFLDHGSRVDEVGRNGNNSLHIAVARIVARDCIRRRPPWWVLKRPRSGVGKMLDILKLLLDKRPDLTVRNRNGLMPLHLTAVSTRTVRAMTMLLDAGAPVDGRTACGRTALHLAVAEGHLNGVRTLIKYGADVNLSDDCGWLPIEMRRSKVVDAMFNTLVDAGASTEAASDSKRRGKKPYYLE